MRAISPLIQVGPLRKRSRRTGQRLLCCVNSHSHHLCCERKVSALRVLEGRLSKSAVLCACAMLPMRYNTVTQKWHHCNESNMSSFANKTVSRLLACWGNGDYGRLGHGIQCFPETIPRVCSALTDLRMASVACGGAHTVAIAGDVQTLAHNDEHSLQAVVRFAICCSRYRRCFQYGP